jgi:type VI protein secretion system component Hcp
MQALTSAAHRTMRSTNSIDFWPLLLQDSRQMKPRVDQLERDLSALRQALKDVQLTPGPQGPAGPQGAPGPQGVQGIPGTPSEVTVNVEEQGAAASSVPVLSGLEVFTQLSGIQGESTDRDHNGWIDTVGYSFGVSQSASTTGGGGAGTGRPVFDELKILKYVDRASPELFIDVARGEHIQQAVVEIGLQVNGHFQRTLKYILHEVFLDAVKPAGSSGGRLLEEVSVTFGRVDITYYRYNADGSLRETIQETWDLQTRV